MSRLQKNLSITTVAILASFIALYLMFSSTWMGATGGLLFATVMTIFTLTMALIVLGIQHYRNDLAYSQKQKFDQNQDVHQQQTIEIDLAHDQAFDLAMQALQSLDGQDIPKPLFGIQSQQQLKIHRCDRRSGYIEAGLRAKTLGIPDRLDFSRIEIQLQAIDTHTTRLQIESQPTNPIEVYDMGRHLHYVNQVMIFIRQAVATDHLRVQHQDQTQVTSEFAQDSQDQFEHEA